jgi:hypothetical protein
MMGWGSGTPQAKLNLSKDDVQNYLERWVMLMGNPHLKVGAVTEKDPDMISAEIVTTGKGDLVQRFEIDRQTGLWRPVP